MTKGEWHNEREALRAACRRLVDAGLVSGSSGNASLRLRRPQATDLALITTHGADLGRLGADGLSLMDMDGEPVDEEETAPSSESALHLAIYRARPGIGAVIHTHPVYATVIAALGRPIPPIVDEMVLSLGGPVAVAEYAFPGTEELASNAVAALGGRMAVLLRNHGLIAVGRTAEEAVGHSLLVERISRIFLYTTLAGGTQPLPEEIVELETTLYHMKMAVEDQEGERNGNHS